jgi:hypothetical protein
MKFVSRGDTTVVDAYLSPILRRYVDRWRRRCRACAVLHAVQRRADRGAPLPGQGRDPVGPGRRHRRHGAHRGRRRAPQGDRLRHGRHQHRRVALCRRVRARVRDPGGRRAHARADDEHPHRGRGRRLDPAVRRRAAARRARKRRRQPGPGQLPPRRAAGGDRRQRAAGQDPAGALPAGVRPGGDEPLDPTACASASRRWPRRCGKPRPRHQRRAWPRASADRGAEHGQRDQAHLGGARLRRHAVHAAVLRRRRRPACLRRGRCAGHVEGLVHPLAGVLSAYGMGLADQIAMREASLEHAASMRRGWRGARAAGRCSRGGRANCWSRAWRRRRCSSAARCTCATRAPTPRCRWRWRRRPRWRRCARLRGRLPPALRLPDARPGAGDRGGGGRGDQPRRDAGAAAAGALPAAHAAQPDEQVRMYCDAPMRRRRLARRRAAAARMAAPRRVHRRAGGDRRGQRHHRGRARLAGAARRRRRARAAAHAAAPRGTPSAPRSTR